MTGYRSRAYARYATDTQVDYERFARSYDRRLTSILRPRPDWMCLDLACGYGNFLAYLRAMAVTRFFGIDASAAAVTVAVKEFGEEHVRQVDAFMYLDKSRHSCHLISAIDFLEHVSKSELYQLLDAIRNALRDDGLFLCRIPNGAGLFGMAARYNDITHESCFTPLSVTDVCRQAGLDVIRIWEDQGRPTNLVQWVHLGAWQTVRFLIRCVDAIETGMWGDGILTRNMWVLARRSRNDAIAHPSPSGELIR